MGQIVDGKKVAESITAQIKTDLLKYKAKPNLTVVLVGDDPASHIYVKNKVKKATELGFDSKAIFLPEKTSEKELLKKVDELNKSKKVHGILVQLPLPKHISENSIINAISPLKDVDGCHPISKGRLAIGDEGGFVPCTPLGCIILIEQILGKDLSGKTAVVVGRSNLVGKPMASLLLNRNATVTIVHSKTKNTKDFTQKADILVIAIGKAKFITKDYVKKGAIVIDVGINRSSEGKLCGDVDFENLIDIASHITPVPGGVGPMTIACLMKNALKAFVNIAP
ncbi:MAG: bifunctional 5,10-methylenetetrahydrofolate dehydrogenase/5,10-methenyltetrahydrofolate cyclohydrolase [Alphaproteobacteria bacterium]|jgi:methylenetetrahydrofolate dehydrogenase (NADP+)/methenyltetrahydrofolate cyclohydrolase